VTCTQFYLAPPDIDGVMQEDVGTSQVDFHRT
jgi:hypothetical protein